MIAESINDLYGRLSAIPALASSIGLLVGGKAPDPGLAKMPLPAAWVLSDAASNTEDNRQSQVPLNVTSKLTYLVMLYVPYTSQQDLIANQFPLLELVINTVHGQTAPSGQRWYWKDYKLVLVNPDRLGYRVSFVLDSII